MLKSWGATGSRRSCRDTRPPAGTARLAPEVSPAGAGAGRQAQSKIAAISLIGRIAFSLPMQTRAEAASFHRVFAQGGPRVQTPEKRGLSLFLSSKLEADAGLQAVGGAVPGAVDLGVHVEQQHLKARAEEELVQREVFLAEVRHVRLARDPGRPTPMYGVSMAKPFEAEMSRPLVLMSSWSTPVSLV